MRRNRSAPSYDTKVGGARSSSYLAIEGVTELAEGFAKMSKKFSVSSTPAAATPAYDAGDPSVKVKGYQMTETSEGVELHEPDRKYSFKKVSTGSASKSQLSTG